MLTFSQQSKEQAKIEQDKLAKRIQEFRTQSELNQQASNSLAISSKAIGVNGYSMDTYKTAESIILATSKGEVSCFSYSLLLEVECSF